MLEGVALDFAEFALLEGVALDCAALALFEGVALALLEGVALAWAAFGLLTGFGTSDFDGTGTFIMRELSRLQWGARTTNSFQSSGISRDT